MARANRLVLVATAFLMAATLLVFPEPASSASTDCAEVLNIWAAGSGQGLGAGEAARWFGQIDERLGDIDLQQYELGTSTYGGVRYEPVGVGTDLKFWQSWDRIRNSLEADASWTGSLGGKYRQSVRNGITELESFLNSRSSDCGDEALVLGGYSQGAQVVGETLSRLDSSIRSRITFVGFFGDPKLYLPEGRGVPLLFNNHACNGTKSAWRRGNVGCLTDNGSLEARVPYLPADLENKTGSWCNREDFVCNNNIEDLFTDAHGNYKQPGGYIDEAAREVAVALQGRFPDRADELYTGVLVFGTGTAGVDVAFLIDSTSSMSGEIATAKSLARSLGGRIAGPLRGRVALTEYRDASDSFVAEVRSPLSSDIDLFEAEVDGISTGGGGDTPEALLGALMTTFDELSWTPGATKAAIVLTDAGYHDPDVATGATLDEVVARSLEIDPVNVYPVVPPGLSGTYEDLASRTSGRVVVDSGDTAAALEEALTAIETRPVVLFSLDEYLAPVGSELLFDASRSYATDGTISTFEWDFDGDGEFEFSSAEPTARHTYTEPFDGLVELRVTDSNGNSTNGVVIVRVSDDPVGGTPPAAPTAVTAVRDDAGVAKITWASDAPSVAVEGFHIRDAEDLTRLGVGPNAREIRIGDLPAEETTLYLSAYNRWGWSESVPVVVEAAAPASSTTSTTSSSTSTTTSTPRGGGTMGTTTTQVLSTVQGSTESRAAGSTLAATGSGRLVHNAMAGVCFAIGGMLLVASARSRRHGG